MMNLRPLPLTLVLCAMFGHPAMAEPQIATSKRIALTFDDAPRSDSPMMAGASRATRLLDSLAQADVSGAMFFATTKNLEARGDEGLDRLRRYAAAGHRIANHSYAHRSANRDDAATFMQDVLRADEQLRALPGYAPYFRFPYLHEGNTPAKRDAIRASLHKAGLKQGYVTVDNYDWYLQSLLDESVRAKQPIDLDGWRDLYLEVLLTAVNFNEDIAVRALGRSPAHVLLLHENDLAALFIDDLAVALRTEGWEIISAVDAYNDPMATTTPTSMLLGQGRVVALAEQNGFPKRTLFDPVQSESALRAMAVRRGLVAFAEGAYVNQTAPGMTPEKFAPGVVSMPDQYEYGSVFSADGREFFFGVATDGRGEIRTTRFQDGQWQPIRTILSHPTFTFGDPYLSRDETRLYFVSNRPEQGDMVEDSHDLWHVKRTREGWSAPIRLGAPVNTASSEYYTSLTDTGVLAFASNVNATRRGDLDVYLAAPDRDGFQSPTRLPKPVNTRHYEADPFIAPDGSYIVFASNRRPNQGMRDLYVTFATQDHGWTKPVALGGGINTPGLELCPFVTRDGRFLFYTSNEDIYWVDAAVIDLARESTP